MAFREHIGMKIIRVLRIKMLKFTTKEKPTQEKLTKYLNIYFTKKYVYVAKIM